MSFATSRTTMLFGMVLCCAVGLVACSGGGSGSVPSQAPGAPRAPGAPSPSPTGSVAPGTSPAPGTTPTPGTSPSPGASPTATTFAVPAGIQHVAFSSDGKLWFTVNAPQTGEASVVGFLDPPTGHVTTYPALTAGESQYLMENEIAAGANGSVWFALNWFGVGCPSPGNGQPCTQAPSMINQVTEQGGVTAYNIGTVYNANLNDLAMGSDGNLYAAVWYGQSNPYGALLKLMPGQTGSPAAIYPGPQPQNNLQTLVTGPNGSLAVVGIGGGPSSPSVVYSFASGNFIQIGSVANPGVYGLAYASATSTYWLWQAYFTITNVSGPGTGYWSSAVDRMTSGGATSSYAMPSSGNVATSLHSEGSDQIAVAPNGSVYYSEGDADKIAKFNPATGTTVEYPSPYGYVAGLAVDGSGNVWVASQTGQIVKISSF